MTTQEKEQSSDEFNPSDLSAAELLAYVKGYASDLAELMDELMTRKNAGMAQQLGAIAISEKLNKYFQDTSKEYHDNGMPRQTQYVIAEPNTQKNKHV